VSDRDASCIQVEDLTAGFQEDKPVCRISSFCLERRKITVLCGPNGVGKSTLLKTIARQLKSLSGKILVDGVKLCGLTQVQIARRLAYVPQVTETRRNLTVAEWVALGRNPHQKWWSWEASAQDRKKIEEALTRTDCLSFREKNMETLSAGEQQRVLIATALAQEPAYMLLDEPTTHLDFRHQLEVMDLLKQLKEEGLGILIVLHDLNLTARIADHVVLLKKVRGDASRIAASGNVARVLSPEIIRDVYGVEMEILTSSDGSMSSYLARSIAAEKN
jgi:iron complex transport system ATP-binding protein